MNWDACFFGFERLQDFQKRVHKISVEIIEGKNLKKTEVQGTLRDTLRDTLSSIYSWGRHSIEQFMPGFKCLSFLWLSSLQWEYKEGWSWVVKLSLAVICVFLYSRFVHFLCNRKSDLTCWEQIREEDIVKLVSASDVMKPAFYIVKHHRRRCVVMGIRGTSEAYDVLTDLNPHSEPFEGG